MPHVANSPAIMECRKTQIVRLTDHLGEPTDTWMVFGQVVAVHIRKDTIKDGVYQTTAANPVLRGGGAGDYFTINDSLKQFLARP